MDPALEVRVLENFLQRDRDLRIKNLKFWTNPSCNRLRRVKIVNRRRQLDFFDPPHCLRGMA